MKDRSHDEAMAELKRLSRFAFLIDNFEMAHRRVQLRLSDVGS